jgi:hypothetical protein
MRLNRNIHHVVSLLFGYRCIGCQYYFVQERYNVINLINYRPRSASLKVSIPHQDKYILRQYFQFTFTFYGWIRYQFYGWIRYQSTVTSCRYSACVWTLKSHAIALYGIILKLIWCSISIEIYIMLCHYYLVTDT